MASKSELQLKTKLSSESKADKVQIDGLPRIGQYAIEKIREQIISKKITATGRTQGSLKYVIDGEKHLKIIAEKGERAPIETLQYGRGPGRMPAIDKLKEWILAKRITYKSIAYKRQPSVKWKPKYTPQERGLNSAAWAIGQKIKKRGTDRHLNNDLEVYSPILDEVLQLFTTFIAKKTETVIINTLLK
jgi:hypothetical protein